MGSVPRSPTEIASSVKQPGDERVIDETTTVREHVGPLAAGEPSRSMSRCGVATGRGPDETVA